MTRHRLSNFVNEHDFHSRNRLKWMYYYYTTEEGINKSDLKSVQQVG